MVNYTIHSFIKNYLQPLTLTDYADEAFAELCCCHSNLQFVVVGFKVDRKMFN